MRNCDDEIAQFERKQVRLSAEERKDLLDKAKANRTKLKSGLAEAEKPEPFGFHTQGSFAMRTITQHIELDYDIDDGVYFDRKALVGKNGGEITPLAARQMVREALVDKRFAKEPEARKNCVRVYYDEGYHIDVPIYRRNEVKNAFTGKSDYKYELASSDWKDSDPLEVTKWFKGRNQTLSPDASSDNNDGQFIRVVRLLKLFRRSRDSWKESIATGFGITKLASDHYVSYPGRDDTALRELMKAIASRLVLQDWIDHPVLTGQENRIAQAGDSRSKFLKERLNENLVHLEVLDKSDCSHEQAMKAWDNVFNTKWFSELPPPAQGSGGGSRALGAVTGTKVIKQGGGQGYAVRG